MVSLTTADTQTASCLQNQHGGVVKKRVTLGPVQKPLLPRPSPTHMGPCVVCSRPWRPDRVHFNPSFDPSPMSWETLQSIEDISGECGIGRCKGWRMRYDHLTRVELVEMKRTEKGGWKGCLSETRTRGEVWNNNSPLLSSPSRHSILLDRPC